MMRFENTLMGHMTLGDRIPVSIATANALESALGIRRVMDDNGVLVEDHQADKGMIKKFNEVHFNLRTLIRNFLGCIDKEHQAKAFPVIVAEGIVFEIKHILEALQRYAPENLKAVFYICTYEDIRKQFKNVILKEPSTQKQIEDNKLEEEVVKNLLKMISNVKIYKTELKGRFGKTLIMTHYTTDLLFNDNFQELKLLESHTGAMKGRSEWKTKLTGAKDFNVPFNRVTLQVFGDSSGLFKPYSSSYKKVLGNIALYSKWHPLTKDEKFMKDISSADLDKDIKRTLLALM